MTPLVHIPVSAVNSDVIDDKVALQLLNKLDKGAETVTNLHSLLMTKTGEMNQLVAQLELIQQVLTKVEYGTQQIENVLKEMGQGEKLLHAEASLDVAIQSANNLYYNHTNNNNDKKKRTVSRKASQQQTNIKKKRINDVLIELELNPNQYFASLSNKDDLNVLQQASADLDMAKSIALSIKNECRRRSALIHNKNASKLVKQLGESIRDGVCLFKKYSNDQPLLLNGVNVLTILDREEAILTKNLSVHTTAALKKNRFKSMENLKSPNNNKPCTIASCKSATTVAAVNKKSREEEIISNISRPTSSSMAKIKEPQRGPGYTLRLRNMLARRNIALKMA